MRYYLPRRTVLLRQEFASGVCLNHVITFGDVLSHYLTYSKMKTGEDKAQSSKNTDERNVGLPLRHWEGRVAKDLEPLEVQLWIDGLSKGLRSKIRRRQQVLPVTIHESSSSEVNPLSALGDHGYARFVGHRARSGRSDPPVERQARNVRCPILFRAHKESNFVSELGAQFVGWV